MKKFTAITVGKILYKTSRATKIGGGSAAPGLYALKIYPNLVEELVRDIPLNIIITGTNGKTTTARMLSHFAKDQSLKVIRNQTGSNLERGIASTLITSGNLKQYDLGIWEVDEATFNKVVFQIKPQVIIFLNAFRDQLDRYGEVDTVVTKWWQTLRSITWKPTIIVNGSDYNTLNLTSEGTNKSIVFKVKNHLVDWEKTAPINSQIKADFEATIKKITASMTTLNLKYTKGNISLDLPLPGAYNVYNFLAAFACGVNIKLNPQKMISSLQNFSPAFGRYEKISLGENDGFIFLIKNPVGATLVFETVALLLKKEDRLLLALNDNFADGTDVSWIWDAKFEKLVDTKNLPQIICSGIRAYDLALRLKYAGVKANHIYVEPSLQKTFEASRKGLKGSLYILPTYTALLDLQKLLAKQGLKPNYWEEN